MRAIIIHYGVGNVYSVLSNLKRAGFEADVVKDIDEIKDADLIVLPGVGSFGAVASYLKNVKEKLESFIERGVGILGICLGMQVMFELSHEWGIHEGLGWFKGFVDRIKGDVKIPHMGWDVIRVRRQDILTEGLDGKAFYFAHSYVVYNAEEDKVYATCDYGVEFPCIVAKGRVIGVQFHPEKSGANGRAFLENLKRMLKL